MSESEAVLVSLRALAGEDPEVARGFLMASVYCVALAEHTTPRTVLDTLWKAMPSETAWLELGRALRTMLDNADGDP